MSQTFWDVTLFQVEKDDFPQENNAYIFEIGQEILMV